MLFRSIGREILRDVKADEAPATVERLLKSYLRHRADGAESFHAFADRHDAEALKALVALEDA